LHSDIVENAIKAAKEAGIKEGFKQAKAEFAKKAAEAD